jgi:cation transport protein ChaC
MWLFAYGSLMWRPGFAYRQVEPACLEGWVRRFWQGSTDHRGTDKAPGRVVTLLPDSRRHCIGLAYQIQTEGLAATVSELDFREKGGYRREHLPLMLRSGRRVTALTYVARPDNRNYLGPDCLNNMADQIMLAHGPSGANLDYLRLLEHVLVEAGGRDLHVDVLMAAIRRRDGLAPLSWPFGRPRFGPVFGGAAP